MLTKEQCLEISKNAQKRVDEFYAADDLSQHKLIAAISVQAFIFAIQEYEKVKSLDLDS